jgi:hypothetical protein
VVDAASGLLLQFVDALRGFRFGQRVVERFARLFR